MNKESVNGNNTEIEKERFKDAKAILFDVDSTLIHSGESAVMKLNEMIIERFGSENAIQFSVEHATQWNQLTVWAKEAGLDTGDKSIERIVWGDHDVLERSKPIIGAPEIYRWLILEHEKKIGIHTSRPEDQAELTDRSLRKRFGSDYYNSDQLHARHPLVKIDGLENGFDLKIRNIKHYSEKYGKTLVVDDSVHDTIKMEEATRDYDAHFYLLTFANLPYDDKRLIDNQRITVIKREDDQNLYTLYENWTGKDRSTLEKYSKYIRNLKYLTNYS